MPDSLRTARHEFYRALMARIRHLLPRLTDRGPARPMQARRALAQLDAILCHLLAALDSDALAAQAIADSMTADDLRIIEHAIRTTRGDRPPVVLRLHHVGLIENRAQPFDRHAACPGVHTVDAPGPPALQWHRFEPTSPLHDLIKSLPHVAFQTANLRRALVDADVILGPFEPLRGYKVAFIDDAGVPTELIETRLARAQAWPTLHGSLSRPPTHERAGECSATCRSPADQPPASRTDPRG